MPSICCHITKLNEMYLKVLTILSYSNVEYLFLKASIQLFPGGSNFNNFSG
jgi:hypothetical protein